MDPDATASRILTAFEAEEYEEALDASCDLRDWLDSGGFEPVANLCEELCALAASESHCGAVPATFRDAVQMLIEVAREQIRGSDAE